MAKKADLLAQAQSAGLKVSAKNTIAELETLLEVSKTATNQPPETASAQFAKAGKRSQKVVQAEAAEADRQVRKSQTKDGGEVPKPKPRPASRPRHERHGKNYRQAWQKVDRTKVYSSQEAIELAQATASTKFDSALELHLRLNLDPRQADQNIRASVVLPAGIGKPIRVAVYAEGDDIQKALEAGADLAGGDDFLEQLDQGKLDFDVLISSPNVMSKLSRYAKVLGPKGLMPNPKSGTVSPNLARAVKQAKQGQVEYRLDEHGIVHLAIGRISFSSKDLVANLEAVIDSIKANKPASLKGSYVASAFLATTMGPSIRLQVS